MLTEQQIADLAKQFGRVKAVSYNGVDLVFRRPKRHEATMYLTAREAGGAEKAAADEQLAQWLIVQVGEATGDEARKAFNALLDDYPLLPMEASIAGALGRLAGVVQDEALKSNGSSSRSNGAPPTHSPTA
jgi:hypothetical protein